MAVTASRESDAVDTVVRMEYGRVGAGVAHIVRDVGIAEELVQDALVAALVQWPESGIPDNPGAWLMATAKHRAIDLVRRRETYARKLAEVGRTLEDVSAPEPGNADDIDDDLLRLVFTACHPLLSPDARIAPTFDSSGVSLRCCAIPCHANKLASRVQVAKAAILAFGHVTDAARIAVSA